MSAQSPAIDAGGTDMVEALRNLMRHAAVDSTGGVSPIRALVRDHMGVDPLDLPGFSDAYHGFQQINLQAALDTWLAEPGREGQIIGVQSPSAKFWEDVPFSRLLTAPSFKWGGASVSLVDYQMRPCGVNDFMPCLDRALVLFKDDQGSGVLWINHKNYFNMPIDIEVLTNPPERAPRLIAELQALSVKLSPYKGQMFRLRFEKSGPVPVFLDRPTHIGPDEIILPDGVLRKIEQHTVAVARKRDKLKALDMHLKRGILLHGPPGTGKTHTIRYLASQMPEYTVVILPKQMLAGVRPLLEILEPVVIVLDDIDLVSENRALPGQTDRKFLFEVLETLDGMNDKSEVLFVLTTNRIDTMEPAIAGRPGRVDQTVAIPPPDDSCRRQLFELYSRHVDLQVDEGDVVKVLERTSGVTASFFKELLRRATVMAVGAGGKAGADGRVPVNADVLFAALDQMLDPDNPMTLLLLGAQPEHALPGVTLEEL